MMSYVQSVHVPSNGLRKVKKFKGKKVYGLFVGTS